MCIFYIACAHTFLFDELDGGGGTHIDLYTYMHMYKYVYIYVYIYIHYKCIYTYTYIHRSIYIHTYVLIHTLSRTPRRSHCRRYTAAATRTAHRKSHHGLLVCVVRVRSRVSSDSATQHIGTKMCQWRVQTREMCKHPCSHAGRVCMVECEHEQSGRQQQRRQNRALAGVPVVQHVYEWACGRANTTPAPTFRCRTYLALVWCSTQSFLDSTYCNHLGFQLQHLSLPAGGSSTQVPTGRGFWKNKTDCVSMRPCSRMYLLLVLARPWKVHALLFGTSTHQAICFPMP